MIKCIVAGSRDFNNYTLLCDTLDNLFSSIPDEPIEIVSGGARGADRLGELFAKQNDIPVKLFLPDWDTYGKAAGCIRNTQMAKYATHCVVFVVNNSKGSSHMVSEAKKHGLVTTVIDL